MDLNFSELQDIAKEAGFATVPVGTYHVEVERAEHVMTSTDKPMFKVMYRLIPGLNGEVKGTVWNNFVISKDSAPALAFFFRHMDAMGLPKDYFKQNPTRDQVCEALIGRQCRIKVEHREYNGAMQPDVKNVMKPVAGPGGAGPAVAAPGPASVGPAPAAAGPAPAAVAANGGAPAPAPAPAAAPAPAQPAAQPVTVPPAPDAPTSF